MESLIDRLPDREQRVIRLYADETGYDEIEEATGLKQGTLRVIVTRTRQKLIKQFNEISKQWKK